MPESGKPERTEPTTRSHHAEGRKRMKRRRKPRPSGGYRKTVSFPTATIICAGAHWVGEACLDPRPRTVAQMIQAARSGRQDSAAGSRAAVTSSQTQLRVPNVARSSQEELRPDVEDFLRHRRLAR